MADGGQRRFNIRHGHAAAERWAVDHQHFDAKLSRRFDLRIGCRATGILADNKADAVFTQQVDFVFHRERPTRRNVTRMRHAERRLDRINASDEVIVLRRGLEGQKLLTTQRKEGVGALGPESAYGAVDIGHTLPVIISLFFPCGTLQCHQRYLRDRGGLNGVGGYARRVRVGGIHQQIEVMFHDKGGKSAGTAKAAASHRHRLHNRVTGAASQREQKTVAGVFSQFSSQNAGMRRAAKNEYGACHGV